MKNYMKLQRNKSDDRQDEFHLFTSHNTMTWRAVYTGPIKNCLILRKAFIKIGFTDETDEQLVSYYENVDG